MSMEKFSAVMGVLVPQIILLINEKNSIDEITATNVFNNSEQYAILVIDETKLWHFSPLTLFNMFDEEKQTGKITFPEEV